MIRIVDSTKKVLRIIKCNLRKYILTTLEPTNLKKESKELDYKGYLWCISLLSNYHLRQSQRSSNDQPIRTIHEPLVMEG